jgi:hypothetical protein
MNSDQKLEILTLYINQEIIIISEQMKQNEVKKFYLNSALSVFKKIRNKIIDLNKIK